MSWLADGIAAALEVLDERSRRVVEERWLKVQDDGSGGMTLHELASGVRRERRAHPSNRSGCHEEDEGSFGRIRQA
jgi:hypothetical protein